ncbi:septum formation initiator family protein [Aestuariibius sp. HNIBRBA575]|uniref:FtsB family cell division protein n=1 Tax=Aestuariibius sp. HNIBRBA575 TaxID=3233343 RepID=UPI0034A5501C
MTTRKSPALGALFFLGGAVILGSYFSFAAVQGDYGVFRRAEVEAEARALRLELAILQQDVARMENLTRRLSDQFLDLDLLDERARDVLGLIRSDEVVIR